MRRSRPEVADRCDLQVVTSLDSFRAIRSASVSCLGVIDPLRPFVHEVASNETSPSPKTAIKPRLRYNESRRAFNLHTVRPTPEPNGRPTQSLFFSPHPCTKVLPVTSRCVTVRPMTVPGKGGRPRKWRSDADRVRAYRARQSGVEEPPTLVEAFDDGDELARTWQTIRELGEQLDTANTTIKQLRRERDQARRELEREHHRWGWIESRNTELAAERDRLTNELAELHDRVRVVETQTRPAVAPIPPAQQPLMSRAERRRLEREQQHRRRT